MTIFSRMTSHFTPGARTTIAAPTRPPIRAWEDDEGSPKYQVSRFQAIAPKSPAITTTMPLVVCDGVMTLPTVLATS